VQIFVWATKWMQVVVWSTRRSGAGPMFAACVADGWGAWFKVQMGSECNGVAWEKRLGLTRGAD
jgi:hypothetical protein